MRYWGTKNDFVKIKDNRRKILRKVQRLPEPDSLKNNAGQWTKDLLEQTRTEG